MSGRTVTALVALGAAWALLAVFIARRPEREAPSPAAPHATPPAVPAANPSAEPTTRPRTAASDAPLPTASTEDPTELDEPALMVTLRALVGRQAEQALALAREGNARFPDGGGAAERSWVVVKSLTDLGRFAEARSEASRMVARFRGTSWADDVYRHVLEQPAGPPRGARDENR